MRFPTRSSKTLGTRTTNSTCERMNVMGRRRNASFFRRVLSKHEHRRSVSDRCVDHVDSCDTGGVYDSECVRTRAVVVFFKW